MEEGYPIESKRGQIKLKKMFWVSSTKKCQIFKCTGYPEHEMCIYGKVPPMRKQNGII